MKNSIGSIVFYVILFSISILFVSCSSESTITSPPTAKNITTASTTMTKQVAVTTSSPDTIVFLPVSKKTIDISKGMSAKRIAILDKYLSTHTIPTKTQVVSPNALSCNLHFDYSWELENQYQSISGKHLGIWVTPNVISYIKA